MSNKQNQQTSCTADCKTSIRLVKRIGIFMLLLTLALIGSMVYRPYAYESNLSDFHFADFLPNLFSVPVAFSFCLLLKAIQKKEVKSRLKLILELVCGIIIYEFLQLFTGGFDMLDIMATFVGALITYLVGVRFCVTTSRVD